MIPAVFDGQAYSVQPLSPRWTKAGFTLFRVGRQDNCSSREIKTTDRKKKIKHVSISLHTAYLCGGSFCSCPPLWDWGGGSAAERRYQTHSNVLVLGAQEYCFEGSLASFHPVSKQRDMQSIHRNLITESVSRKALKSSLPRLPTPKPVGGLMQNKKESSLTVPSAHSDPKKKRVQVGGTSLGSRMLRRL